VPPRESKALDRDTVFEQLRVEILDGTLPAGYALREVALAERFHVSRTPIRDALSRLEQTGLAVRGQRGLIVKQVDPQAVVQVYSLRILLEEQAAGEAAEARSINDVLTLQALVERDRSLKDPDEQTMIRTNMKFHETVWASAHNTVLDDLLHRLTGHLIHDPGTTLAVDGRWDHALGEHAQLVEAISSRNSAKAREVAKQHFTTALELRMGLLRKNILSADAE
jgi:DNA-binding GntR family transcriptional regulator